MMGDNHSKVHARHLKRNAYLYVRQSTLRQVFENTESTQRQYALRERALALGWRIDQVCVIDSDLGQSGASALDREGFQRLVTEVSLGKAGIVMGLEVSRLARNSSDWHRLLEICALADTLLLDEDGVYDPAHFNDRLVLGLKGTMSEAELHVLRARLRGGILSKARRGQLEIRLPIGFVYDAEGLVRLDPDQRVQQSIHQFFRTFRQTASAMATVKTFRAEGWKFPHRAYRGAQKGDVLWTELDYARALWILHHPRYAGAFCFGRTRTRRLPDGRYVSEEMPREEWIALIPDAHDHYISWDDFEQHLQILQDNAQAHGGDAGRGAPREGPALLQGLVLCGKCGERMTVRYHVNGARRAPDYVCQSRSINHGQAPCQQIHGEELDAAIGRLLVQMVTPMGLEVALAVQEELESRSEQTDRLRLQAVEHARYQCELARRRYMRVDPDNRLVAESLEAEWNQALRTLTAAQEHYEQQCRADHAKLNQQQRERIMALATDFPRLWNDPHTPDRERKRMARLLIADVTLFKDSLITAHVRFHGGATHTLHLPLPKPAWQLRQTPASVVAEIDRLLEEHTDHEIAQQLNAQGMRSGEGLPFKRLMVRRVRLDYGLQNRYERLRARGLMSATEIAKCLKVCKATIDEWRRAGLLKAYRYNDKGQYLFERPGIDSPKKFQHQNKTTSKSVGCSKTPPSNHA